MQVAGMTLIRGCCKLPGGSWTVPSCRSMSDGPLNLPSAMPTLLGLTPQLAPLLRKQLPAQLRHPAQQACMLPLAWADLGHHFNCMQAVQRFPMSSCPYIFGPFALKAGIKCMAGACAGKISSPVMSETYPVCFVDVLQLRHLSLQFHGIQCRLCLPIPPAILTSLSRSQRHSKGALGSKHVVLVLVLHPWWWP